jgi:hypothetical protein
VWPCGDIRSATSNINFVSGQAVANAVVVPVSTNNTVCFYVLGQANLVVDVNGWFINGSGFHPRTPTRVFDTRQGSGGVAKATIGTMTGTVKRLEVKVAGTNGVPTEGLAEAVILNVGVVSPTASHYGGFATVYPCDDVLPETPNISFVTGQTIANLVIAPLSPAGTVCFNVLGNADLRADITGWLSSSLNVYTAMTPVRFSDTRSGLGPIPGR